MRHALWFALLAAIPVLGYSQEPQPSSGAVLSPKATIPSPAESDPARIAQSPESAKPQDTAPVGDKTYVIGAEDVLLVTIWGDQRLSGNFIVRPDGYISMSLIRDVK